MSSESEARNFAVESPRFPGEGSSTQGKSGPKPRTEVVGDGQQVYIPALYDNRTVGTRRRSVTGDGARSKQNTRMEGKSAMQGEAVMPTEREVGKSVQEPSRKAAIVYHIPVP